MENDEKKTPASPPSGKATPERITVGQILREARVNADIPVAKLCSDLRIAPATLEALESGNYNVLAGAPYVRAMLVSLSRYLRIDQKEILQAYAEETGNKPATPTVSPYKDDSPTHARAHKQIFILLLAVLLFVLLLIMGKVSTGSDPVEPMELPAVSDTLLSIEPLPDPEAPNVEASMTDTMDTVDTAAIDTSATPPPVPPIEEEEEEVHKETRVRLLGVSDSIWVRILPAGQREVSDYLSATRPMEFIHTDAITFITRQGRTVRVILDDTTIVPNRRRFVVDGDQVTY